MTRAAGRRGRVSLVLALGLIVLGLIVLACGSVAPTAPPVTTAAASDPVTIVDGSPATTSASAAASAASTPTSTSTAQAATPSTPAPSVSTRTTHVVRVLVLAYYPLTADKRAIDVRVTGDVKGRPADIRRRVRTMTKSLTRLLSAASRYGGYSNARARASLTYKVVATKQVDTAVPSMRSRLNPDYARRPDYGRIMRSIDICRSVRQQGVSEVWIWAYQGPHQLDISESKMSGPQGDISNSYRLNDMPACGRTYTVYTFNYGRGVGMALHSIAHQLEAELSFLDHRLFVDVFEGPSSIRGALAPRCGSVHVPPNGRFDYDYASTRKVRSDCDDWQPDGRGAVRTVSCRTWSCANPNTDDGPNLRYLVWWMQHFPGYGNHVTYRGRNLRNWWDVHADFDAVVDAERGLILP